MLILLPPSEGKTAPAKGLPFDPLQLQFPGLNDARSQVLETLAKVSAHEDALKVLGVGASLVAEVERNTRLRQEPAAPASAIYTGVLYDALDFRGMTSVQRRKAAESIVVISALWGAVAFADRIPAYRLSMSSSLPGLGRLAAYWKPRLSEQLAARAAGELVVDCRSSTYAAAWRPPAENTVEVNVFQERNGKRTVVSHFAKHTRGEIARHLLTRRGKAPADPDTLLSCVQEKWLAELAVGGAKAPHSLNVILPG